MKTARRHIFVAALASTVAVMYVFHFRYRFMACG